MRVPSGTWMSVQLETKSAATRTDEASAALSSIAAKDYQGEATHLPQVESTLHLVDITDMKVVNHSASLGITTTQRLEERVAHPTKTLGLSSANSRLPKRTLPDVHLLLGRHPIGLKLELIRTDTQPRASKVVLNDVRPIRGRKIQCDGRIVGMPFGVPRFVLAPQPICSRASSRISSCASNCRWHSPDLSGIHMFPVAPLLQVLADQANGSGREHRHRS